MTAIPIVCELTDKELQNRREEYLAQAATSLLSSEELLNGYRYRFVLGDLSVQNLGKIVDLERKCCPFLDFDLKVEAGKQQVLLDLTGPEGTKEAVLSLFNWS